jgi:hypothetical protein
VWLGGALFKGWAAGFIGAVVVGAIVVLVSFLAGGDMVVMVEILTVAVVSIMALGVALNVLKKKL